MPEPSLPCRRPKVPSAGFPNATQPQSGLRLHPPYGESHQCRGVLELELLLDVPPVYIDCLRAEVQLGGYVSGALPQPYQLEDFELTIAQFLNGRTGPPRSSPGELLENLC